MKKSIKVLALTTAITGICAGTAMAAAIGSTTVTDPDTGAVTVATATPRTIATERIGAAGLTIADDAQVFYQSTANFVANDVITFTFTNVAFTDSTFQLCSSTTPGTPVADYIGTLDTTNGVSSLVFRANAGIQNTDVLYIANDCALDATPYSDPTNALTAKLPVLTAGASATAAASAVFGTGTSIPGATAAATPIYTVKNQYSMTAPTATSSTISFESALTTFAPSSAGENVQGSTITGGTVTLEEATLDVPVVPADGDKLVLTVNGSMSGVKAICLNNTDTCTSATSTGALTINTTTNTATISQALADAVGTADALTFVFDGTTGLSARTYTLNTKVDFVATNELDRTLLNNVNYLALALNSTQYYVPLVKFNTVSDTFIKLQSKNTSTGTNGVSVQCLATDGSMVTVAPAPASITPGTAYVLQGSQLAGLVTAAGKTVDPNGFAAIITINTPNADTFAYAKLVDPNGTTRVPVKTVYTKSVDAANPQIVE